MPTAKAKRPRLLRSPLQLLALALCAALGAALYLFVDLTPRVADDFFFASDDPQLQQAAEIAKEFGATQQVFVAVRSPTLASKSYLVGLRDLTHELSRIDGVTAARSITHGPEKPEDIADRDPKDVFKDLTRSPFWSRLLLAPDRSASFVVLSVRARDQETIVADIDRVLASRERPQFELAASGVPYVSEHIRQRLTDELRFFSLAAFGAFAVLMTVLFRSAAIVIGTMVAALSACFATFLTRAAFGMETDILTPNLWTIAFVLTLSHVVYLAAEWRQHVRDTGAAAVSESMRLVGPASAWSLTANLLGFGSLLFVSAQPLRQFGTSGAIAAVLAMACAYLLFPPFLAAANPESKSAASTDGRVARFFTSRHPIIAAVACLCVLALAPFAWRVDTDPSLPSYFAEGDRIRNGIEAIDRSGGSSPLDIVVEDARGRRLDDDEPFERLERLQRRLEQHSDVGSVLSIAALMAETERPWYSFLFSWKMKLKRLDSADAGHVGRTFISDDRRRGRFYLRMKELARDRPREDVIGEIETIVRSEGFKPALVAGLYPLQGELSTLVEGSVLRGLAGLIGLFAIIVLIVTRSVRTSLIMAATLALPPLAMFGLVGYWRMPVDIISAPAANVALPMGIDEMIHVGYAVRRQGGKGTWPVWQEALHRLWRPILASMLIVTAGFALFLFSNFPPTRRLGLLVCIGAALTDLVVLVILPALAARRSSPHSSRPI